MSSQITPLSRHFCAEIKGVDIASPLDESTMREITDAFHRYSVIIFREQDISPQDQIRFSRCFGELEVHVLKQYLLPEHPEILVISNAVDTSGVRRGLFDFYDVDRPEWHADYSWSRRPSLGSALYCLEAPVTGGQTMFAASEAALDALPTATQERILGLRAVHSLDHLNEQLRASNPAKLPLTEEQRRQAPPVTHPLVRVHPVTGRRSLFIGNMCISEVIGLEPQAGQSLVNELVAHATAQEFVYTHTWRKGDLLLWDNRSTLHAGPTPYDVDRERRTMYRTTIAGDIPLAAPGPRLEGARR
ncbi:TauD/TfdA dioxygenase family protein [Streptomyces sp. OE57]|uniref:TauD/TfdA dioxygenase family protein n=1 Tax=Streptomyces lacaronensis TaxID=3379885 RepID=UPI0039B75BC9